MPQPRKRHDSYGRPLPMLAPVAQQSLMQADQNTAIRRYVAWLLEQEYEVLLHRGTWAHLRVDLQICDGLLRPTVQLTTRRRHQRAPREDE